MQESGEMYLETILVLNQQQPAPRAIDIANAMGFSKPSVSRAIAKLKDNHLVILDSEGKISLTPKGKKLAEKIYERHVILTKMLTALGVDEKTASEDGCKMEHYISDRSFEAMKEHFENFIDH